QKPAKEPGKFNIGMERFEIRNAVVHFLDDPNKMSLNIKGLNFLMKGGLSQDFSKLDIHSSVDLITMTSKAENANLNAIIKNHSVTVKGDVSKDFVDLDIISVLENLDVTFAKIKYLKNTKIEIKAGIEMDIPNSKFTFKENEVKINQLALGFGGEIQMLEKDLKLDVKFDAQKTDFKNILSFIPAMYMSDFKDLKTSGKLAVNGYAKGIVGENSIPAFGVNLLVENAMFQYPELPKSVDNINVKVNVVNDGRGEDNTEINVEKFHLELANNPFDATLHIKNPVSDPHISGNLNGKIDLSSLKDALPMQDITLNGKIETNVDISGKMSSIEKQQYEKFRIDGNIKLSAFKFKSKDFPQEILIKNSSLNFSPKFVELVSFDSKIGKSDFKLSGKIENFLPFVFKNELIKGIFVFNSNLLDLNEFIVEEKPKEKSETEEIVLKAIKIPKNIDFKLTSNLKQIYFDKMDIKNTKGIIMIKNSKASLENLKMDMLQGNITLNGSYDSKNIEKPTVDFGMKIVDFDIPTAFHTFNTMKKLVPIMKDCKGKFSTDLTINSLLDETMQPVMNSIDGKGNISSKNIQVINPKSMEKIANALKMEKYKKFSLKDFRASFTITNGELKVKPFTNKIHNSSATIGGIVKTDQTLDFDVNLSIPRSEFTSGINKTYDDLINQANSAGLNLKAADKVDVDIKVTGNVTDPKVKLDMRKSVERLKKQVKDKIQEELDKKKKELENKAKEEADKLLKEAEDKAKDLLKGLFD
ncbi:MAG: hypothetical protein H8E57_09545, partial [Candidatus Cloacimonetes bacterium]|nr:hypothetical protein [Candidatus Cloacimonadota bacterium]